MAVKKKKPVSKIKTKSFGSGLLAGAVGSLRGRKSRIDSALASASGKRKVKKKTK